MSEWYDQTRVKTLIETLETNVKKIHGSSHHLPQMAPLLLFNDNKTKMARKPENA